MHRIRARRPIERDDRHVVPPFENQVLVRHGPHPPSLARTAPGWETPAPVSPLPRGETIAMVKEHAVPGALAARLLQACRAYRDRPALDDGAEAFSYADLQAEAETLAGDLRAAGLLPHEPVAVAASNRARRRDRFPRGLARGRRRDTGPPQCGWRHPPHRRWTRSARASSSPPLRSFPRLPLFRLRPPSSRLGRTPPPPRRLLEDAGFILFSSGTTGEPKAMVVGHQRFSAKLDQINGEIGFEDGTRSLLPLQLTFRFRPMGGADHLAAGRYRAFAAAFRTGSFAERSGRWRHRPGAVRADDAARDAGGAG